MARREFTIGAPQNESSSNILWTANVLNEAIPGTFLANTAATYYLARLRLAPGITNALVFNVSNFPTDTGGVATGQEISDALENSSIFATLQAGGLEIILPGPNHSDNQNRDSEEPYSWRPSAAKVTELQTFFNAYRNLTANQKAATVLILDDEAAVEIGTEIRAGNPTFAVTPRSQIATTELSVEIRAGSPVFDVRPDRELELYCIDPDRADTTDLLSTADNGIKIFVEIAENFNILSRSLPDGKIAKPLLASIPEVSTDDTFFKSASDVTIIFNNEGGNFDDDYIGRFVQIWGMSGGSRKRLITTGQVSAQRITRTEARFTVSDIPVASIETELPRRIISDTLFPTSQDQNSPVPIVFGRVLRHRCLSFSQGISTTLIDDGNPGDNNLMLESVRQIAVGDVLILSLGNPEQETVRVAAVNFDTAEITISAGLGKTHTADAMVTNAINVYDYLLGEGVMGGDNFQEVFRVYHEGRALPELRSQATEQEQRVNFGSQGFVLQDQHHVQFSGWYENYVIDFYGADDEIIGSYRVESYDAVNNRIQITASTGFDFCYYILREYRFFDGSQASPYPGYAFIRLARPYTGEITADVNGFPESSPASIIKELVSNQVWGADETSNVIIESDITGFKLEGVISRPTTISRLIQEVAKIRELKFFRSRDAVILRFVADQSTSERLPDELSDYIRAPVLSFASLSERTKRIEILFRRDERTGEFNQALEETEGLGQVGAVKEIEMPFVYEQLTADRVLFYKKQQVLSRLRRAELEIAMSWFLEVDYNPRIGDRITIPGGLGLGDADTDWIILAKRERCDFSIALTLSQYSQALFNYPGGRVLPVDDDNYKPLTDFSETPPEPVRALQATTVSVEDKGEMFHFSDITFIPPGENYSTAQIWLALAGGDPVHVTDEIPGLAKGTARINLPSDLASYEVIVYSVNAAGNLALLGYPVSVVVNETPIADAGDDQNVSAGATVTLDGSGSSDPDNDPLSYLWEQISGEPVTITNPNSEMATFPAPSSTSQGFVLEFQLTVSDGTTSSTDVVTINVARAVPPPPPRLATPGGLSSQPFQAFGVDFIRYSWNSVTNATGYQFSFVSNGVRITSNISSTELIISATDTGVRVRATARALAPHRGPISKGESSASFFKYSG